MKKQITFFIDFDSTFVTVESLDLLAQVVLEKHPKREQLVSLISEITTQGMEGKISFKESLRRRMELFSPTKYHLKVLTQQLENHITSSFLTHRSFFDRHRESIYILSSGFKEYIIPVARKFGIQEKHVLANSFLTDSNGTIIGYNSLHPLAGDDGKVALLKEFDKKEIWYMIGDGYTDYQVRKEGLCDKFFAFVENVKRPTVMQYADVVANNFTEVIQHI